MSNRLHFLILPGRHPGFKSDTVMSMSSQKIIWIAVFIGSSVGSYLPVLWGGSFLSFSSVLGSGIGGLVGLFVGIKIGSTLNA